MARVVQRRTGSYLHLLVVFVFLFLLSAVLAVVGFIQKDKEAKDFEKYKVDAAKIFNSNDQNNAVVKQLMEEAGKPGTNNASVVGLLLRHQDVLAQNITGELSTYDQAKKAADDAQTQWGAGSWSGLVKELAKKNQQLTDEQQNVKKLIGERTDAATQKNKLSEQIKDLMKKQEADLAKLKTQITELDKQISAGNQDYIAKLSAAKQETENKLAELEKNITEKTTAMNTLQADIRKKDALIKDLQIQLAALKGLGRGDTVARTADGKIIKLLSSDKICYINLGSKNKITPGLTLAIYPSSGIPEDGKNKGTLRVQNVFPDTSECMIVSEDNKDPITVDNLVANLAKSSSKTYTFVVEGMFDLRGTGASTLAGADDAKDLIKRSGGKLATTVDYSTDFVVLGDSPSLPSKPAADASPQVEKIYRDQMKIVEHFKEVEKAARELGIPILNTNRFLNMMGYNMPKVASN